MSRVGSQAAETLHPEPPQTAVGQSAPSNISPSIPPNGGGFLPALTGLRFFAALHVVGHHLRSSRLIDLSPWPEVDRFFLRAGASVGLFFILSGFILTYGNLHRLRRHPLSHASFYRDRFARVYPVYLFGLLLTLPLFLAERSFLGGGVTSTETLLFGGMVLTLTQARLPQAALAWNIPGWSLSVEIFFYGLFPFALVATRSWSRKAILSGVALCGLIATGLAFYVALNPISVRTATGLTSAQVAAVMKYDPLVRLPEFLFGMLIGQLFFLHTQAAGPSRSQDSGYRAAAIALSFIGILAYCPKGVLDLPIHNGLLAPLIGMLLWYLALGGNGLARVLSHPVAVLLGNASFAIFIVHTPIIQYARLLFGGRNAATFTSAPIALGAAAASVVVAILVHKLLEVPLRKRLSGRNPANLPASESTPQELTAAAGAR